MAVRECPLRHLVLGFLRVFPARGIVTLRHTCTCLGAGNRFSNHIIQKNRQSRTKSSQRPRTFLCLVGIRHLHHVTGGIWPQWLPHAFQSLIVHGVDPKAVHDLWANLIEAVIDPVVRWRMCDKHTPGLQHLVDVSVGRRQVEHVLACSTVIDNVKPTNQIFRQVPREILNDARTFEIRKSSESTSENPSFRKNVSEYPSSGLQRSASATPGRYFCKVSLNNAADADRRAPIQSCRPSIRKLPDRSLDLTSSISRAARHQQLTLIPPKGGPKRFSSRERPILRIQCQRNSNIPEHAAKRASFPVNAKLAASLLC